MSPSSVLKDGIVPRTDGSEDNNPPNPTRKHPAHHPPIERHNMPVIIFLTVCTHHRNKILSSPEVHKAIVQAWESALHWKVGRYVIMPDHIHLFCSPSGHNSIAVVHWVAYWKRLVSQTVSHLQPIWQRDCWDTQLRRHESYTEEWEYLQNNPVRAGLVQRSEDWPYHGTLNHLPW